MTSSNGTEYVLRLTEPSRRSEEAIQSELHWQRWLKDHGANCVSPMFSVDNQLVEELKVGDETWLSCLFSKAQGRAIHKAAEFTPELMAEWGRTLANLHKLTMNYQPPASIEVRPNWNEDFNNSFERTLNRIQDSYIKNQVEEFSSWIRSLPQDQSSYGLVHTDLHNGNFFWDGSRLAVFDFDDCCYHWFMYDLAVPLFYLRLFTAPQDPDFNLQLLESHYIQGYNEVLKTEKKWLDTIEKFIDYRALIMRLWSEGQLLDQKLDDNVLEWCRNYIKKWEEKYHHQD